MCPSLVMLSFAMNRHFSLSPVLTCCRQPMFFPNYSCQQTHTIQARDQCCKSGHFSLLQCERYHLLSYQVVVWYVLCHACQAMPAPNTHPVNEYYENILGSFSQHFSKKFSNWTLTDRVVLHHQKFWEHCGARCFHRSNCARAKLHAYVLYSRNLLRSRRWMNRRRFFALGESVNPVMNIKYWVPPTISTSLLFILKKSLP